MLNVVVYFLVEKWGGGLHDASIPVVARDTEDLAPICSAHTDRAAYVLRALGRFAFCNCLFTYKV